MTEQEFTTVYEENFNDVKGYLMKKTCDPELAEDLTSQTFVQAWARIDHWTPDAPIGAWLHRIAHNTLISHFRSHRLVTDLEDAAYEAADSDPGPETLALQAETRERVQQAIAQLPSPEQRQVLRLRFFEELDGRETAERMGRNLNSVRVLQHRALSNLRCLLREEALA